jgi:hypothetical protein
LAILRQSRTLLALFDPAAGLPRDATMETATDRSSPVLNDADAADQAADRTEDGRIVNSALLYAACAYGG